MTVMNAKNETKTYEIAKGVNADRLAICLRKHGFKAHLELKSVIIGKPILVTNANASVINLAHGSSSWRVISNIWA